jgi:hypothetical protein
MERTTGFASYLLTDIKRLTIVRISRVGHSAYGDWSFYFNGYHHNIFPSLKSGLEELLAAQKQITEEPAPLIKVGSQSIQKVHHLEPLQKIRFAPDKHNAIRIVPFVRDENLWEIEIGGSGETIHGSPLPTEGELRLMETDRYIAPWRKGLSAILAAMRGEF